MKILYEIPWKPSVEIKYLPATVELKCFGLSCGVPQKGDQIQAYGGPRFEIVAAWSYGACGFEGVCRKLK